MPDSPLAENVDLLKTDRFSHVHVPLGGLKSLGRHIECRIVIDGPFGNQYSPGMNAAVVGKIVHQRANALHAARKFIFVEVAFGLVDQHIDLIPGQSVHLTQLTQYGTPLECGDGSQQGRMLVTMPLKNVVLHLVAVFPREVDVKIGR
jgi:hypothetical protein